MNHRGPVSAAALALLITFGSPAVGPVAGQAPTAAARTHPPPPSTYTPPRTPWGHPDLQGVYDYQTSVPTERPADLAGKPTLTDAERAQWLKQRRDPCGQGTRA